MLSLLLALTLFSPADGATIRGVVRAVGSLEPVPNATVHLPALGRGVVADAKGFYVLSDVPAGRWEVRASALGYAPGSVTVASDGTGVVRADFELALHPVELEGIDVEAEAGSPAAVSIPPAAGPAPVRVDGPALELVPGLAEPDVLRALQFLPSVAAISDFSSALYIRGGSADHTLITLDGVPLFNPYHVGGLFSAIGSDAVSSVDVFAGALPASAAGDRVGASVAIHTRDGGRDRVRASGAVGLISAHATFDGPLPGGRGAFLFTGRRTYLDAATDAAHALGLIDFSVPYGFTDAYLKATRQVGELGTLSLSGDLDLEGIGLTDEMREEMGGDVAFDWGSRMLALTYRRPIAGSMLLRARAGWSEFRGDFDSTDYEWDDEITCTPAGCTRPTGPPDDTVVVVQAHSLARDALVGADLTWYRRRHTLRFGAQLDAYAFDNALEQLEDADEDLFTFFSGRDSPVTFAAFAEDHWRVARTVELRLGGRVLEAGDLGRAWMPRLGARWQATPRLALTFGAGRYAQPLRSMRDDESVASSFFAYDIVAAQPREAGLATSQDVVVGAELDLGATSLRVDAYARRLHGLVLPPEYDDPLNSPVLVVDSFRIGKGEAHGLELLASHRRGAAEFVVSYALSWATREHGGESWTPRFERRHMLDLSAVLPWDDGSISARAALGSGQPYTPVLGLSAPLRWDPNNDRWRDTGFGGARFILGRHNSARLPHYLRLDVAARRSFEVGWFGGKGTITPYLQILNVLNTRNALLAQPDPYERSISYWPQLPFLPTFGVEWRF